MYSKDLNYTIEAKDKKEAIKKAKEYAELHNIKAYLVMNARADVIAVVDENDGK